MKRLRWISMALVLAAAGCSDPAPEPSTAAPALTRAKPERALPGPDWRSEKLAKSRTDRAMVEERRERAAVAPRPVGHAATRFADLMTLASPLVEKEQQRRWRELRVRIHGGGPEELASADRRELDEIVEGLAERNGGHPIVAEIVRRAKL